MDFLSNNSQTQEIYVEEEKSVKGLSAISM
jgi:hypothetical protein